MRASLSLLFVRCIQANSSVDLHSGVEICCTSQLIKIVIALPRQSANPHGTAGRPSEHLRGKAALDVHRTVMSPM